MNIIYSDKRSRLTVENVANLMIINLIGLPFSSWEPTPSVKKWLRRNHSADDNRVKKKTDKEIDDIVDLTFRILTCRFLLAVVSRT